MAFVDEGDPRWFPPSPELERAEALDIIRDFRGVSETLRELVINTSAQPTTEGLGGVSKAVQAVTDMSTDFIDFNFFKESGDPSLVRRVARMFIEEIESNKRLAAEIMGQLNEPDFMDEQIKEAILEAVGQEGEEEFEGYTVDLNDEENIAQAPPRALVILLAYQLYWQSVGELEAALLSTDEVQALQSEMEQEKLMKTVAQATAIAYEEIAKQERAKNVLASGFASLAGTAVAIGLAALLQRRRRQ